MSRRPVTGRAVGVRAPYAAVPARVRAWVDDALGSPVTTTAEQVGGMSPGCATRLVCADGTRAFVKAVGRELNPDTPTLFRREVTTLRLIGAHPRWAALLDSYDDGDWVALLLEDVDGARPDLDDEETMAAVLEAVDDLGEILAQRAPHLPAPDPAGGGLNDVRVSFGRWAEAFDQLTELPAALVPRWVVERSGELQQQVEALAAAPCDRLVHGDVRDDNLLVRPSGEVVLVDWGAAGVGADWHDPLLARLHRVESPWFDAAVAASPTLARAGDDMVDALLVGLGTFLAWRAHTAVDVNLPTLQEFRLVESARLLGAAARRLGME